MTTKATDEQEFDLWLDDVETILVHKKVKYRTKSINQAVLSSAFQAGQSPTAFVVTYKHVAPPRTKRRVKRKPAKWLRLGIASIFVLLALGVLHRVVLTQMGERKLDMFRVWGNIELPIDTELGPYFPSLAREAQAEVEQHLRDLALVPETLEIEEWGEVRMQGPGRITFVGFVRSENNYGNTVSAQFSVIASTPFRQEFLEHGSNRVRLSDEWSFQDQYLGKSGDASVWRDYPNGWGTPQSHPAKARARSSNR